MLIEANMTIEERKIDNEIQQLKSRILLLDKEYGKIQKKKHKNKTDLSRLEEIKQEVGFYATKINKLYEKIKRGYNKC